MTARELIAGVALLALPFAQGCSKAAPPSPGASASAAAESAPAAIAPAPPAGPRTWIGSYKTTAGALYVVKPGDAPNAKEWENTRWHGDDTGTALGDGTLTFRVDPTSGRVEGSADGALGPIKLSGLVDGSRLSLSLTRLDPKDDGLVGTGWATIAGEGAEGQMRLSSLKLANVLREGTFTVKRQAP